MIILRIGSYHGAPFRYINLFRDNENFQFYWLYISGDKNVEDLINKTENYGLRNITFLKLRRYKFLILNQFIAIKLGILLNNSFFRQAYKILFKSIVSFTRIDPEITSIYKNADLIWGGNNDLDLSIGMSLLLKIKFKEKPIIFSYLEHRSTYRIDENLILDMSDKLLLPTVSSLKTLSSIYRLNLVTKTTIANEDWRSKEVQFKGEKIKNNIPRILLITNFLEFGKPLKRRGSRVNFLKILRTLCAKGCHIDVFANHICESETGNIIFKNSPYDKLASEFENFNLTRGPLKLDLLSDYEKLYGYDYGILHNFEEGEVINRFNRFNIPNRTFEYLCLGIDPILVKNTFIEVEKLLIELKRGIIIESWDDLMVAHEAVKEIPFEIKNNHLNFEAFFDMVKSIGNDKKATT